MKKWIIGALALTVVLGSFEEANAQRRKNKKSKETKTEVFTLKNDLDTLSYSLAVGLVSNLMSKDLDSISVEAFNVAVSDLMAKKELKIKESEAKTYVADYYKKKQEQEAMAVKVQGEKFLAENAKKEGVKTTASGLQYKVINSGDGKQPEITDKVKVHYHGTLVDGSVFDSSVQRGKPAQFPVNAVIRGWVEALQLMHVGDKWTLYIPYDLAYGSRSTGRIPAYSMLIFEVELLDIM